MADSRNAAIVLPWPPTPRPQVPRPGRLAWVGASGAHVPGLGHMACRFPSLGRRVCGPLDQTPPPHPSLTKDRSQKACPPPSRTPLPLSALSTSEPLPFPEAGESSQKGEQSDTLRSLQLTFYLGPQRPGEGTCCAGKAILCKAASLGGNQAPYVTSGCHRGVKHELIYPSFTPWGNNNFPQVPQGKNFLCQEF